MKKIARIAVAAAICIFNTMEAKDGMETLTPKEKSIALSAAYAAKGDQNGLKTSLADGLASGGGGGRSTQTRRFADRCTHIADTRAASTRSELSWGS